VTIGRIATFALIFLASLALAGQIVRRHREHDRARAALAFPQDRTETSPSSSLGVARAPSVQLPQATQLPHAMPAPAARSGDGDEASASIDPLSEALCPLGMVLIDGTTCGSRPPTCAETDPSSKDRCLRYSPAQCRRGMAVRACIDRDEYPNIEGMLPATLVTFREAESACSEEGKRLCTETEWAFACEGPKALAFSYGDTRDAAACNIGRAVPSLPPEAFWEARDIGPALARVDARVRSGTSHCQGPFGARDLIGNVEEWVRSDSPGFEAALRGGSYAAEPTCRSTRQIRQAGFRQAHTGFRCCQDPLVRVQRGRRNDRNDRDLPGPAEAP
jgi:hypothetical protein